ncbi:remorin-like [Pistacia vera]|uniref:remorin-like n=1 Tax=Pistacia vera TaxID=55513 RepID=UPI00126352C3|nr:remorin-like [Pistacia vera]
MAEEGSKKAEAETEPGPSSVVKPPEEEHAPVKEKEEPLHEDPAKEKFLNPVDQKVADPVAEEKSGDPVGRDAVLARVESEKRLALVKAWEDNEKAKADNRAYKRFSAIASWENSKKALVDVQLKKYEEKMERKKAEYAERMKNKISEIHKAAEEKRAMIEARRGEDVFKVEETAEKFLAAGYTPWKFLGCFSA